MNKSTLKRIASVTAIAFAFVLASGSLAEVKAQRDPFRKAGWATPKKPRPVSSKPTTPVKKEPVNYAPPAIEARIEYYKRLRAAAMADGLPLPKVTSVLTLAEMSVSGIFKTPRGYAAMVEATPIKLSYTVYPGEKFFDGQLVAVEENRLVFRKVTKVGEGKFVASVENKPLKEFSIKAQLEGTAPTQAAGQPPVEIATSQPTPAQAGKPASNPFLSPVDEMENTPEPVKEKEAPKGTKKPAKVAKNNGQ